MTATTTDTLYAHPIPADDLERMRRAGRDDMGNEFTPWTAEGGEPLRCCLHAAVPGEDIALISYSPHRRPSPWAEAGPVFVHPDACAGFDPHDGLPPQLRSGPRVLRAYRGDGSMNYDANVVVGDGEDVEPALAAQLARDDVDEVHVRSTVPQCFTYAVRLSTP
jgi:uncharacterized protein DUF1203